MEGMRTWWFPDTSHVHRAWAVRFLMAQASLRRPSRQTLHQGVLCLWSHSVSTDVLVLLPCKEIRKVIPPVFGILASLAWPEATQTACSGHPHKAQTSAVPETTARCPPETPSNPSRPSSDTLLTVPIMKLSRIPQAPKTPRTLPSS